MGQFFGSEFFPRNFILLGSDITEEKKTAEMIAMEAAKLFPNEFKGIRRVFPFELRYVAPFDHNFYELKRLQGTAAVNAGYRNEYLGYIIIDVTEYLKHENEDYFDISLKYLHDRSDCWKYIFLAGDGNTRASMEMVRKILSILHCGVRHNKETFADSGLRFVRECFFKNSMHCAVKSEEFFVTALERKLLNREALERIAYEIHGSYGKPKEVSIGLLLDYFASENTVVTYITSKEQQGELLELLRTKSEKGAAQ